MAAEYEGEDPELSEGVETWEEGMSSESSEETENDAEEPGDGVKKADVLEEKEVRMVRLVDLTPPGRMGKPLLLREELSGIVWSFLSKRDTFPLSRKFSGKWSKEHYIFVENDQARWGYDDSDLELDDPYAPLDGYVAVPLPVMPERREGRYCNLCKGKVFYIRYEGEISEIFGGYVETFGLTVLQKERMDSVFLSQMQRQNFKLDTRTVYLCNDCMDRVPPMDDPTYSRVTTHRNRGPG